MIAIYFGPQIQSLIIAVDMIIYMYKYSVSEFNFLFIILMATAKLFN